MCYRPCLQALLAGEIHLLPLHLLAYFNLPSLLPHIKEKEFSLGIMPAMLHTGAASTP